MKKHRSEPEWRELYHEHLKSGLSSAKFCKSKEIASSSYSKWYKKFSSKPASFQRLKVKQEESLKQVELELPGNIKLRINL